MPNKILFFIDRLGSGGKERRFVELLTYLKENTNIEMQVVLTDDQIHYTYIYNLDIPIVIIKRRWFKKDPAIFFHFLKITKHFEPDIIHTWGIMSTFYAIPARIFLKRPIIANLIADAKMDLGRFSLANLFFESACYFSNIILANSKAGLSAYGMVGGKSGVIYNGVRLERFNIQKRREEVPGMKELHTKYIVIMVASFSKNKDYDLFLDTAKEIGCLRKDVTFVGVGDGEFFSSIKSRITSEKINNVKLLGRRKDIEDLITISDIGVLFTPCEGISNSIIEYMALRKPVITTDVRGGSREIIEDGVSGYILNKDLNLIVEKITAFLDDGDLCNTMGMRGREIIESQFAIEKMGDKFLKIYKSLH
ncbi:MAG: glycosyltransferase involved in cell wall biosynthesis [Desulforhopalus sp.]|jgi:glycosyltransferase involved in cell wall biosynthesis